MKERLRLADSVAGPLGLHGASAGDPVKPGFRARRDGLETGCGTKPPPGLLAEIHGILDRLEPGVAELKTSKEAFDGLPAKDGGTADAGAPDAAPDGPRALRGIEPNDAPVPFASGNADRAGALSSSAAGTTAAPPGSSRAQDSRLSGKSGEGAGDAGVTPPVGRASGSGRPGAGDSFGSAARAGAGHGSPFAFRQPSRPHSPRARKVRAQSPAPSRAFSQPAVSVQQCWRPILMQPGIRRQLRRGNSVRLKDPHRARTRDP